MPEISVLMATYKEPRSYVETAINSILDQTYTDFELLIIQDGPENEELSSLIAATIAWDSRVKTYKNGSNIGLASSLNRAIDLAAGRYICRMDADDISENTRLEAQLNELKSRGLDLIGGGMQIIDENARPLYKVDNLPTKPNSISKALRWNNCVPHPTWFGKRETFAQKYRNIPLCEDYDFLLRAAKAGVQIGNTNQIVLNYRMSRNSLSRSNLYEQYLYQCYITDCYSKGEIADITAATDYVKAHLNNSSAARYSKANEKFNIALNDARQKHYFAAAGNALAVPFTSSAYFKKVIRLALASLHS